MMRIITGTARGCRLQTLPGEEITRPTAERVKQSVFNTLQFEVEGRAVLDLFAGSGQMGLEAMSRGAASCVFTDISADACEIVRQNARAARLTEHIRILQVDADTFCARTQERFDIVFLDPPYRAGLLPALLGKAARLMNIGGAAVCETDAHTTLPDTVSSLSLEKQRRYGKTVIWLYRADGGKEPVK